MSIFEDQLEVGRLTTMKEASEMLDRQLVSLGRIPLRHGGEVSKDHADREARRQYGIFDTARKAAERRRVEAECLELRRQAKDLPKPSRSRSSPES